MCSVTCVVQQGTPDSCMTYKIVAADSFMIHTITKFRRLATSSKCNCSLHYYFVILSRKQNTSLLDSHLQGMLVYTPKFVQQLYRMLPAHYCNAVKSM